MSLHLKKKNIIEMLLLGLHVQTSLWYNQRVMQSQFCT